MSYSINNVERGHNNKQSNGNNLQIKLCTPKIYEIIKKISQTLTFI